VCKSVLPPGDNPVAVKYIISYHIISYKRGLYLLQAFSTKWKEKALSRDQDRPSVCLSDFHGIWYRRSSQQVVLQGNKGVSEIY